jgi:hypothetical protein
VLSFFALANANLTHNIQLQFHTLQTRNGGIAQPLFDDVDVNVDGDADTDDEADIVSAAAAAPLTNDAPLFFGTGLSLTNAFGAAG